ncbi:Smr domain-containing protein [Mycoplasmopsis maculosa]|uniref:Smr domain-containing protein n=1 Tax=Mycoplasmopsis maculosa TaxID=114885 RepID=A0A449B416_9BACT|nr:Smr/MutS family protein [Mycoplasmopsis maculosa]VEU75278.1 Smr domain-containing protein [Mycoplasmopsis maculosa]
MNNNYKLIDLHGCTIDEAIAKVSFELAFIDNLENFTFEIIVGKGTGTLKIFIENYLIDNNFNYSYDENYNSFFIKINNNKINLDEDEEYYLNKFK